MTDPVQDLGETEFVPGHRAVKEFVSSFAFYFQFEAVSLEENISSGEGDSLVAVDESVIVAERLHQRGCLFFDGIVVADLGAKDGGLNGALVEDAMSAAKSFNQLVLHQIDFGYGQVLYRHLARRSSRSRFRATDRSKAFITSGRTRC